VQRTIRRLRRHLCATASGSALALAAAAGASAHAGVSPPVLLAGEDQVLTLVVPNEKEDAQTTKVEVTPPDGFEIESVAAAPGWQLDIERQGSGEEAELERATWSGGSLEGDQAGAFQFVGNPGSAKSYSFSVRQTYSDGSVVDWSGAEASDAPAPTVEAVSDLGGGGSSSTLAIVALVLGGAALIVAVVGLLAGRRSLA
jgi:uncharacterized protein YcnI